MMLTGTNILEVPTICWYLYTKLHSVTSQEAIILIFTVIIMLDDTDSLCIWCVELLVAECLIADLVDYAVHLDSNQVLLCSD
jgi:hypothetical protein